MPRGDKSAYTDKQQRQAEHIEESYEDRGLSSDEAERRAWATVNKQDGGGKRAAALNPIRGADRIVRFFAGVARKNPALAAMAARPATVNGLPGFVLRESDGSIDTMAVEHRGGRIVAIYLIRNPEKLQHVRF